MTFILTAAFIILLFMHLALRDRVVALEAKLRGKEPVATPSPTQTPAVAPVTPASTGAMPVTPVVPPAPPSAPAPSFTPQAVSQITITPPAATHADSSEFFLYSWFKTQALIKIGAIIFFLGAAWFVSYAVEQNWISPLARILLGIGGAVLICAIGHWRARASLLQYQVLTVLGTGVLIGTVAASQFSFQTPVLPATLALALMVAGISYSVYVAVMTKTEWLAIVAAIAGLCSPLLIAVDTPDPFLLLTYLVCVTIGFLTTAFFTTWRNVVLLLAAGVSLYILGLYGEMAELPLWFFVCIFTSLFTASVTSAIFRSPTPTVSDVLTLATTLLLFLLSAYHMAFSTAIALFIGAGVTAYIAHELYTRGATKNAIGLYALISIILLFMGTSELFSGVILTSIFALEALLILIGSCYVSSSERSISVSTILFSIPLISALYDLEVTNWDDGIWNSGLFGVMVFLGTLWIAVVWLLEWATYRQLAWIRTAAAVLLSGWFFYLFVAAITLSETFTSLTTSQGFILITSIASLLATTYIGVRVPHSSWRSGILIAWIPSLLGALMLLSDSAWETGLRHGDFLVGTAFLGILLYLNLFYLYLVRSARQSDVDTINAYTLLWILLGYMLFWLHALWHAVYPENLAWVAQYVSYFILIYGVVHLLLTLRVRFSWIVAIIGLGGVPLLFSLSSYTVEGWSGGWLDIHAVGIYASTVMILTLASTLVSYAGRDGEHRLIARTYKTLFWIGGLQAFALVWMLTHTIAQNAATAVTVALFVYTIVGLVTYSYGRARDNATLKRIGVLLLASVVLRLALVDVWTMETLWRIVTFLGIGSLFIITALLERGDRDTPPQSQP